MEAEHVIDGRLSRIPYGMRGLKSEDALLTAFDGGRIPYGMRGLKLDGRGFRRVRDCRIPYGMRGLKSDPHPERNSR